VGGSALAGAGLAREINGDSELLVPLLLLAAMQ
jgi:hypothetical protein